MSGSRPLPASGTPVDGHVHLYAGHDHRRVLDAAVRSMRPVRADQSRDDEFTACGILCLTEDRNHDSFSRLAEGRAEIPGWSIVSTGEAESLWATRADGARLLLVAGFQVVTAEGLEVLALGTSNRPEDGLALDATTHAIAASSGLPVLPWAFGKWWFGRGKTLVRHLAASGRTDLWLGDNGGRPPLLPGAAPYALGSRFGLVVLPGSDPLPISGHEERAGSYGFVLPGDVPEVWPAQWFKDTVTSLEANPPAYGGRSGWLRFVRDQAALRKPSAGSQGSGARAMSGSGQ
ncbi:MAG: hypothetical protein R3E97_06275 [Candidatus Eisenbacteria bacterium]